ncbi:hypothetical protein G9A89_016083 [Geosiphon pyriformis]|nr:hypothetical protein G9A89_016083 [Geosiphon pyriformis]
MHSNSTTEHFHKEATIEKTRKKYYWPSMYPDIIQYVQIVMLVSEEKIQNPTMKQDTTQATPFELVYGRTATLPVEIEVSTYLIEPITEKNFKNTLLKRTYNLMKTLENK